MGQGCAAGCTTPEHQGGSVRKNLAMEVCEESGCREQRDAVSW